MRKKQYRKRLWLAPALAALALLIVLGAGDLLYSREEELDLREHLAGSLQRVEFHSRILHAGRRLFIYLPPGYNSPANAGRRYPVVYLLHGCPGEASDWVVQGRAHTTLERMVLSHAVRPMILVMPDLRGRHGSFDCNGVMNTADGSWRAEDDFVQEVVPRVDASYRTLADPGHRAVAGISMGGFAAVNLTVRHPDLFAIACSMSGYFRAGDFRPIAYHVYGRRYDLWQANSPMDTITGVPDPRKLHIYLDCGTEDGFLDGNREFADRLRRLGVDSELRLTRGSHGFTFWSAELARCLTFADERFRRADAVEAVPHG